MTNPTLARLVQRMRAAQVATQTDRPTQASYTERIAAERDVDEAIGRAINDHARLIESDDHELRRDR